MKTLSVIWLTLFSIENFLLSSLHKLYNSIIYLIKCRFFGISKSHLSEETTFEIYLLIFHLALYILEAGYMYKKGRLLFPRRTGWFNYLIFFISRCALNYEYVIHINIFFGEMSSCNHSYATNKKNFCENTLAYAYVCATPGSYKNWLEIWSYINKYHSRLASVEDLLEPFGTLRINKVT